MVQGDEYHNRFGSRWWIPYKVWFMVTCSTFKVILMSIKHLKTVSAYFGDWCNKLTCYMYMYINLLNLMPSYILYYN